MAAEIDARTARALEFRTAHYVTAVAEQLMADGVPVTSVYSCGPYSGPEDSFEDVEGGIDFTHRFGRQISPDSEGGLHWTGTSGWCYLRSTGPVRDFLAGAGWMEEGLLPEPHRVAAFLDTVRLTPAAAGSRERPRYRATGRGVPELLDRLAGYVPGPPAQHAPQPRFAELRARAYHERVRTALAPQGPDPVLELPLRASEFQAVLHLLEYAEVASSSFGPGVLAGRLSEALQARRGPAPKPPAAGPPAAAPTAPGAAGPPAAASGPRTPPSRTGGPRRAVAGLGCSERIAADLYQIFR
ncbi:hypothetical protein GCM10018781_70350 [Kitasatospora indigofera]|uniref:DUF6292 domain-containing protein n=1 Tax=Kitasatospora indigofera TaxID=67307 RepID=A0A919GEF3_9ACTN|nr:DUF6292 family protein [Kitasatospora indigofera]GHH83332.1 hypothetical protein GCM10018781_70350 [Kitasatospora indigofera]